MHFRASKSNLGILDFFEIRPIVLVRNIFEVFISMHNYLDALYAGFVGSSSSTESWFELPFGYDIFVDQGYFAMTDIDQLNLIIDNMLPWYLNFYASWNRAIDNGQDAMMLDFSTLKSSEVEFFAKILDFWQVDCCTADIVASIDKVKLTKKASRMDVGRPVHARVRFSDEQRDRVIKRVRAYSYLNFESIM